MIRAGIFRSYGQLDAFDVVFEQSAGPGLVGVPRRDDDTGRLVWHTIPEGAIDDGPPALRLRHDEVEAIVEAVKHLEGFGAPDAWKARYEEAVLALAIERGRVDRLLDSRLPWRLP